MWTLLWHIMGITMTLLFVFSTCESGRISRTFSPAPPIRASSFFLETQEPPYKGNISVIICYFASSCLNCLNCYWFYLLSRKAVRMAKGQDKDKDK